MTPEATHAWAKFRNNITTTLELVYCDGFTQLSTSDALLSADTIAAKKELVREVKELIRKYPVRRR